MSSQCTMSSEKASNNPGLCPVKGQKPSHGTRQGTEINSRACLQVLPRPQWCGLVKEQMVGLGQTMGFDSRHLVFPPKWFKLLVHTHMDSCLQFYNLDCHVPFGLVPLSLLAVVASYQCQFVRFECQRQGAELVLQHSTTNRHNHTHIPHYTCKQWKTEHRLDLIKIK